MRTDPIAQPRNDPYIIIRRWAVRACEGNGCAAALLERLLYVHRWKKEARRQAQHLNAQAASVGIEPAQFDGLWQWHSAGELEDMLLGLWGRDALRVAVRLLAQKGFVTVGANPDKRMTFDRTRWFFVNIEAVQAAAVEFGGEPPDPAELVAHAGENPDSEQNSPSADSRTSKGAAAEPDANPPRRSADVRTSSADGRQSSSADIRSSSLVPKKTIDNNKEPAAPAVVVAEKEADEGEPAAPAMPDVEQVADPADVLALESVGVIPQQARHWATIRTPAQIANAVKAARGLASGNRAGLAVSILQSNADPLKAADLLRSAEADQRRATAARIDRERATRAKEYADAETKAEADRAAVWGLADERRDALKAEALNRMSDFARVRVEGKDPRTCAPLWGAVAALLDPAEYAAAAKAGRPKLLKEAKRLADRQAAEAKAEAEAAAEAKRPKAKLGRDEQLAALGAGPANGRPVLAGK